MRALAWVSVASAMLLAASSASGADVIRDRNEFSIDLTKADLCFIHPIELRRTEACATFAPEQARPSPLEALLKPLATGLKRTPDGTPVVVTVVHVPHGDDQVTTKNLESKVSAHRRGLSMSLPSGARVDQAKGTLATVGALPMLRVSVDVGGLAKTPEQQVHEHQASVHFFGEHDYYVITAMGPAASRDDVEALIDDLAQTATLTTPRTSRAATTILVVTLATLAVMGVIAIAGVFFALAHQRRRAQQQPAPPNT